MSSKGFKDSSSYKHQNHSYHQNRREEWLLNALSEKLGATLEKRRFDLEDGWFELDGFSEEPTILCEVWSNAGLPKSAQRGKIMTDASKLLFANSLLENKGKCFLLFTDEKAAGPFLQKTWMSAYLRANDITVEIIPLPDDLQPKR